MKRGTGERRLATAFAAEALRFLLDAVLDNLGLLAVRTAVPFRHPRYHQALYAVRLFALLHRVSSRASNGSSVSPLGAQRSVCSPLVP